MGRCGKSTPTPVPSPQGGGRRQPLAQGVWLRRQLRRVSLPLEGRGQGWGYLVSTELRRKLRRNSSPPERAMWRILWHFREQGWHFRRQVQIDRYYVDFACLSAKVIVEVDGDTHGTDPAMIRDAERDEYLRSHGFMVVRYSNGDVMSNADGVFAHLAGVLGAVSRIANTPHPGPPPQGGRRPSEAVFASDTSEQAAQSSPSALSGRDRGGGS
jgi:very-short-patch-repair endonuclease